MPGNSISAAESILNSHEKRLSSLEEKSDKMIADTAQLNIKVEYMSEKIDQTHEKLDKLTDTIGNDGHDIRSKLERLESREVIRSKRAGFLKKSGLAILVAVVGAVLSKCAELVFFK